MKPLLIVNIVAYTLFLTGDWHTYESYNSPTVTISNLPLPTQSDISANRHTSRMWTCNSTLYKNEVLVLHFAPPNPLFLGIIDPSGHFFYIVFPREHAVGELTPFIESVCFAHAKTLVINTGTLHADPYTYDVYTNQPVFTKSGTYTFIMGDNLHVDNPNLLEKLIVRYVDSDRYGQLPKSVAINSETRKK
jgi:hypothetical protein